MTFITIVGLLIFAIAGWIFNIFIRHLIQNIKDINNLKKEPVLKKAVEKPMIIYERIGCLGYYMDKEIPSHVKLDTGELFEYENLATLVTGGIYIVPDPTIMRIRVDNNLIFKLVTEKTNK